jgi:hypothetical protein
MKIRRFITRWFVAASLAAAALSAQQWTARTEYDLALAVRSQPAPEARLALIDEWKKQFPASPLAVARAELALSAAQALGDPVRISAAARELAAADANNFAGQYWITLLTPSQPGQSTAALDAGASAAQRLLAATGPFFASPAMKTAPPATVQADQNRTTALAHRTLGWVEWKRGNLDAAKTQLMAGLTADPQRADLAAWLGAILAPSPNSQQRVAGIYYLARAAYLDGDGVLPSAERREVRALLEAAYASHHGSLEGLDQIGTTTRSSVSPPDGFRIETAAEAAERTWEDKVLQANPEIQPYLEIRRRLLAAKPEDLPQVLASTILPRMKATLIGCNPESRPTELQLGITRTDAPEVLLKLDSPLPKCPDLATVIEFEGTLTNFSKDPYLLTLQTSRKSLATPPPPTP